MNVIKIHEFERVKFLDNYLNNSILLQKSQNYKSLKLKENIINS